MHSDGKLKAYAPKLDKEDRDSVAPYEDIPYFDHSNNQSHLLCFTTAASYEGQVKKKLSDCTPEVLKSGKKPYIPPQWQWWAIGWGRIVVDEVHTESNEYTGTISKVRALNTTMRGRIPRKLFLTGTPFETSPAHMAGWVGTLQDSDTGWAPHLAIPNYPRMNNHRQNL